jgi:predicted RNA-binding Zn-ribbon protein involved in translation (DUF1610 family)
MNTRKLTLLLAAAFAAFNLAALAGPDPQQVYRPLNSQKELGALKPGTMVAHECPHCGAITTSKTGKDKAHAESHTCPVCKMKVTYRESGSGKPAPTGLITCVDAKTGKEMSARVCSVRD